MWTYNLPYCTFAERGLQQMTEWSILLRGFKPGRIFYQNKSWYLHYAKCFTYCDYPSNQIRFLKTYLNLKNKLYFVGLMQWCPTFFVRRATWLIIIFEWATKYKSTNNPNLNLIIQFCYTYVYNIYGVYLIFYWLLKRLWIEVYIVDTYNDQSAFLSA